MKSNKKVIFLLENGLSIKTVTKMSPSQVNVLVEKFKKMKKEESKEQVEKKTKETIIVGPQGGPVQIKPGQTQVNFKPDPSKPGYFEVNEKELSEDQTDSLTNSNALSKDAMQSDTGQEMFHGADDMADDGMGDDSGENRSMMGMAESQINEKFESKAQQGLFWARCNKCSSKNCKWCKMAKEFSDSTSKKQYKNMPEKKHPEKTVKYKKKKTNEDHQSYWENRILEMLDEEKKKKQIQKKNSESYMIRRPKKLTMFSQEAPMELPIGKMFSIGKK